MSSTASMRASFPLTPAGEEVSERYSAVIAAAMLGVKCDYARSEEGLVLSVSTNCSTFLVEPQVNESCTMKTDNLLGTFVGEICSGRCGLFSFTNNGLQQGLPSALVIYCNKL